MFTALLLSLAPTSAQTDAAYPLLREGDQLSNGDTVLGLENFYDVRDDGRWVAVVETDRPGVTTPTGYVLVDSGTPILASGDLLPGGEVVSLLRNASLDTDGRVTLMVEALPPGSNDLTQVVWFDGTVVLGEGPFAAPGLPMGTEIDQILGVSRVGSRFIVELDLRGSIDASAVVQVDVQGGGAPPVNTLLLLTGAPGPTPGSAVRVAYWQDLSSNGEVGILYAFDPAPPSIATDFALRVEGVDVLSDGAPGPLPGTRWRSERVPSAAIANGARWAAAALFENTTSLTRRSVLLRDGVPQVFEGSPIPGAPNATFGSFEGAPVALADDGALWAALPRAGGSGAVLWRDGEVLLRTGLSTAGGVVIVALADDREDLEVSRSGRRALLRGTLQGGIEALLSVERDLGQPEACAVTANSTGAPGRLTFTGSTYLAANQLTAVAAGLPLNSFGYLNVSRSSGFVANPGGSLGNLCLGAPVGRYVDQVRSSGATGTIETSIDLLALPRPTGPVAAQVGETWRFQLWHRDAGPQGPSSNWTAARAVIVR